MLLNRDISDVDLGDIPKNDGYQDSIRQSLDLPRKFIRELISDGNIQETIRFNVSSRTDEELFADTFPQDEFRYKGWPTIIPVSVLKKVYEIWAKTNKGKYKESGDNVITLLRNILNIPEARQFRVNKMGNKRHYELPTLEVAIKFWNKHVGYEDLKYPDELIEIEDVRFKILFFGNSLSLLNLHSTNLLLDRLFKGI